jgi:hypothetical protein
MRVPWKQCGNIIAWAGTQMNVRTRLSLIEYFERRMQEEQDQLDYITINSTWFRIRQVTQCGGEVDITEREKDGVRRAIEDYRKAIEYLKARDAE